MAKIRCGPRSTSAAFSTRISSARPMPCRSRRTSLTGHRICRVRTSPAKPSTCTRGTGCSKARPITKKKLRGYTHTATTVTKDGRITHFGGRSGGEGGAARRGSSAGPTARARGGKERRGLPPRAALRRGGHEGGRRAGRHGPARAVADRSGVGPDRVLPHPVRPSIACPRSGGASKMRSGRSGTPSGGPNPRSATRRGPIGRRARPWCGRRSRARVENWSFP